MALSTRTFASRLSFDRDHPHYKWIVLSNTTLGMLVATINASIVIISLPDIFRGLNLDPLSPGNVSYLLWMLMGFLLVTAVLVVTLGRLGDIYGRVRIYNLGFVVFTIGSVALAIDPFRHGSGALWIILWRVVQGVGAAMLFANATAILTDAFPANRRGFALGINQVAAIAGSFIGLILGGLLAPVDWRLVFFVSVPFGLLGTLWSYHSLRESSRRSSASIDWTGNVLVRGRVDRTARRDHLWHPALRRPQHGMDQPMGPRRTDRRNYRSDCLLRIRIPHRRADVQHVVVPDQGVLHRKLCRSARVGEPRRAAVHADYLAARHLAATAWVQL